QTRFNLALDQVLQQRREPSRQPLEPWGHRALDASTVAFPEKAVLDSSGHHWRAHVVRQMLVQRHSNDDEFNVKPASVLLSQGALMWMKGRTGRTGGMGGKGGRNKCFPLLPVLPVLSCALPSESCQCAT